MSNKVTYAEIIEALSRETDFSKQKSEAFSKALIGLVKKALEDTGKASITNFGSFKVKRVAERQGQNPQTGEPITIPAHNRVSFTPYKALKEKVNAKYAHLETELLGEKEEKEEKQEPEIVSNEPEQKEEQPEEKVAETIFQFDEAASDKEDEKETDNDIKDNPFAFDEPEEEPDSPDDPEPEEKIEFEEETEEPVVEEEKGSNMVLIMAIAAIFAIAMVSIWWFFLRTEPATYTPQQAAVEQPVNPQPATNNESNNLEKVESGAEQGAAVNPESTMETEMVETGQESIQPVSQPETESMSNIYEVNQNEWFWVIAEKVYGMSRFWTLIYQENFSLETHPDSLANRVKLRVPELEGTAENPTPSDYQRLAEATALVAEAYEKFGRTDKAEEYARFAKKWERLGTE
tara:strand:- start:111 stop:1325 length:1215 start_codon:yes stop_codon:yes gene_type:complete